MDTDGFRVPPGLLGWHNRHKLPCRVTCLGEYYRRRQAVTQSDCAATFSWARVPRRGNVNMSRYAMWTTSGYQPPRGGKEHAVAGMSALVNATCQSVVDLRNGATWSAFNLTQCISCYRDARANQRRTGKAVVVPKRGG